MIGSAVWLALTAQASSLAIIPMVTPVKPLFAACNIVSLCDTFDAAPVAQAPSEKP